MVQDIENMS